MSAQWMTNRDKIAEKLRPAKWNQQLPRLADEGDALVIAKTAGFGEEAEDDESQLYDLILNVDCAINDLEAERDGGDREQIDGPGRPATARLRSSWPRSASDCCRTWWRPRKPKLSGRPAPHLPAGATRPGSQIKNEGR
jgi:hypothetical protein